MTLCERLVPLHTFSPHRPSNAPAVDDPAVDDPALLGRNDERYVSLGFQTLRNDAKKTIITAGWPLLAVLVYCCKKSLEEVVP
jgi:hypothetical protein